ncbi:MAG TPA: glutamate--tRNA ligase [Thermoplasmata archaeon]|nr:glutamate--tRNA ligase [Thermoplasmata archaeon]
MPLSSEVETRARRLVLENAVEHEGEARVDPILSRLLATDPALRPHAAEVRDLVSRLVADARSLPPGELADRLAKLGGPEAARARPTASSTGEFPDLPGAIPGQVVLRLAPFPSGVLHIGHGRMLFINQLYRERYGGKILLVFDDTAGSEEKRVETEFIDLIRGDCEAAGVHPDAVYYKSDRLPLFYTWARRVIDKGATYVCRCSQELLRERRAQGVACPERSQTPGETVDEWEKMLGGAYAPGEAVLRLKTDLQDPDPAFRDRVLFRISELDHPRVGTRYRVWPMLEFSWAVDDIELGITHVLRGKDLVIEDRMQRYIWDLLGLQGPPFLHWGILRVREAKVAKSKAYREIKSGLFDGWADPRTWSLRSLDRRGITNEAVRAFILSFGMSLSDIEVPAETLYAENRKRIDATTVRRAYVPDPTRVEVDAWPEELRTVELPNHPDRPELGKRAAPAGPVFHLARRDLVGKEGSEVRLKELANIQLPSALPPPGETVRARFTSRENKRIPRLQWVGEPGPVPVTLLGIEGERTAGLGEAALAAARPGEVFQFERVGFVRVEQDWTPGASPLRVVYGHP